MLDRKSKIKLIIFDFDGTLAQTKGIYWNTLYKVLQKEGYGFSKNYLRRFLGRRVDIILGELKTNPKKIEGLQREINNTVIKKAHKLRACPALKSIEKINVKKVLVTNSLIPFITPFIKKHNLGFEELIGGEKLRAKEELFRDIFKKYKIKPGEAIYLGDRREDVEIAHAVGCISVIINNHYSWDSLTEIKKAKPEFIIKNLSELKRIIS